MRSTITDVATLAGVSMKTVSRVLNGEPNVSAKTKEKVDRAAKELKYAPSLAARGLASSKSYLIALLYDIPSPGYVTNIMKGATGACRKHGYHLVVEPVDITDIQLEQNIETTLRRLPVDGVILTPPLCDNGAIVALLNSLKIPYIPVSPSTSHGEVPYVSMDNTKAAIEMTEYLINLGHKDIGFVKGHPRHSATATRYQGFREAMRNAGLRINPNWIADGLFTYESGIAAAEILLRGPNIPTAVFASNDESAAGVIAVANRKGLSVPGNLSVCGFDDVPIADIISPRLTTVRQPVEEMGCHAAKLLLSKTINKPKLIQHEMDYTMVIRESTGSVLT